MHVAEKQERPRSKGCGHRRQVRIAPNRVVADRQITARLRQAPSLGLGHLLVPDDFLVSISDAERPSEVSQYDVWLERQRKAWGVSGEMILRRLLDAGRLSQSRYEAYRQWAAQSVVVQSEGGNREWRHREPRHIFGDTFVRTVLDSLYARHITLAKASGYLDNLKIKDLHQLERYYEGV